MHSSHSASYSTVSRRTGTPPVASRSARAVVSPDPTAFMWLIAGVVSLGPQSGEGLALLRQIGIPDTAAPVMLIGAAILDILLGILTLLPRRTRLLWTAQILLVLLYTAIISVFLPALWLEPFGPVAKNVPILVVLWLLRHLEARR